MRIRRQQGFTLTEIMIAVAILAIISAIAIPLYQGYISEARFSTALKDIRQIELLLDDLASDGDLVALDANNTAQLGTYLDAAGNLALGPPGTTPAGTSRWEDPWGGIYRYQRPANTSQDYLLFSQGPDTGSASDDVSK